MIMKRLTPEQAFQAFKENREIYTLQQVDPNMTVMELMGINEIAEEDETAKSLFEKIGLIERKEE